MKIVVADHDMQLRTAVAEMLRLAGYDVVVVADGSAVLREIFDQADLLLIERDLPYVDGLSVCRHVRDRSLPLPILMVSSDAGPDAAVVSLDSGSDDYLAKPYEMNELLARVRALLRRALKDFGPQLCFADLAVNTERRQVYRAGHRIELTLTEYSILEFMLHNVNIVLRRSAIYERIWGIDLHESSKSLDVHVGGLRRKLEQHGPRIVHTVRGVGYVIREPEPD